MQTLHALELLDELSSADGLVAGAARDLIDANRWYQISNSSSVDTQHREHARKMAKALLFRLTQNHPDQADALNLLGRIALDEGETSSARDMIEQAIALNPEKTIFWINRGYVSIAQKEHAQAEEYFTKALACDSASVQAFSGIALSYFLRQDYLGAFLRYRSLLRKNLLNQSGKAALLECCTNLKADHYDTELEQDLLSMFDMDDIDHLDLGNLSFSLLRFKYDLDNDDANLDLEALASDTLLICALSLSDLTDTKVEELITLLRQSILVEVVQTGSLRDELQQLALSIGLIAERTDYLFSSSNDETILIEQIDECIRATVSGNWNTDDLAGALIVVSMYKSLYNQNYSYKLMNYDRSDWPAAMQLLLQANLYDPSDLHAIRFNLPSDTSEIANGFNHHTSNIAYPRWKSLPFQNESRFYEALKKQVAGAELDKDVKSRPIRILVTDCQTGENAMAMAKYFTDVEVVATDGNPHNIAYAINKSREINLQNISFYVARNAVELPQDTQLFDFIDLGEYSSNQLEYILKAKKLCQQKGLIRLNLTMLAPHLSQFLEQSVPSSFLPSDANVRQIREQLKMAASPDIKAMLEADRMFYSLSGTRNLLRQSKINSFDVIETVLEKTRLEVTGNVHYKNNNSSDGQLIKSQMTVYVRPEQTNASSLTS
ncbi:MAG: tetratricopeptide repeat protein [Pseudomonadales bacterium]|nr:tetratricopeptide repeat protein [Pseudomonadales bacterium]